MTVKKDSVFPGRNDWHLAVAVEAGFARRSRMPA